MVAPLLTTVPVSTAPPETYSMEPDSRTPLLKIAPDCRLTVPPETILFRPVPPLATV
jgi:hypothetical protein